MTKQRPVHKNNVAHRDRSVAEAITNLTKAQQHNVLQFKVLSDRGHIRVWRYGSRDRHLDWWPYHRRAKLRYSNVVTKHRNVVWVDHCLNLLDYGKVEYE